MPQTIEEIEKNIPHFYFTERVCEKLAVSFIFGLEPETTGSFIITNLSIQRNTQVLQMINLTEEIYKNLSDFYKENISLGDKEKKDIKEEFIPSGTQTKVANTIIKWFQLRTLDIDYSYPNLKGYERVVKCATKKTISPKGVYIVYLDDDEKVEILNYLKECEDKNKVGCIPLKDCLEILNKTKLDIEKTN